MAVSSPPTSSPPTHQGPSRWDVPALVSGGALALVVALAATGIAQFLDDDSPVRSLLVAITIAAFVFGAALAAWAQRRDLPLSHGIVTAVATYVITDTVFVIIRLIRGLSVNWLGLVLKLTLVAGAGLLGGSVGALLRRRGFVPSTERSGR